MISGPDGGQPPNGQGLRLLVGLGNPGPKYVGTRHNVGFDVLDLFAHRLGIEPEPWTLHGKQWGNLFCSQNAPFALFWPTVFMNRSGGAVLAALRTLDIPPENMLILTDDFNLPLGALRLRASGSCGGHNGLRDVESSLQSLDYPRMRLGVGDPGQDTVDFVLETFRTSEEKTVQEMLETASWAAEDWAKGHSLEELQIQYNRRKPQA